MQIYKFGGASVKDAEGVRNVAHIITQHKDKEQQLIIVVSAMGKTTNLLENLTKAYYNQDEQTHLYFEQVKEFHQNILEELFEDRTDAIYNDVSNLFVEIDWILEEAPQDTYDYLYDQIVSIGELVSSRIIEAFLRKQQIDSLWLDARNYIHTDNTFREGNVDWEKTERGILSSIPSLVEKHVLVTQGFIGSTSENFTTTLGREGSDYTAAIFAACLNASLVTIWKDVPGVLNADPKWFDATELIPELSYLDAIELTYYGATVIHPKTIKPLQNKGIALAVRSFVDLKNTGTIIKSTNSTLPVSSFIFKVNQVLISILPKDFSFIVEDNFSHIFDVFAKHRLKINMMHNSAVSFSVSVDYDEQHIVSLVKELRKQYDVEFKRDLELVTIRYHNQQTIERVLVNKKVIMQLQDNYTCQMLIQSIA
ncbi:aspartate kinase [Olivibacter sp. SDN3]|uniref:aspartate kinase n=1 Tax=Olivibacter sp. SDN3 TaxID=2764720 RepID=UPI001651621B|nr:aspartate kinase [Olivibacter sp. SDN3]QNL49891.1 aspartate kinase [Olivibacter sp. SDN3]